MPNAKNQSMLSAIKEDLEGAGAVWVVDACGLTVKEVEALRNAVRESGACMKEYTHTVMRIALSEAELPTLDDMLHGPSAFVFAGSDVAAAAKAVKEFAKSNENLQIKGGLIEPSREELYAHIAAAINGVAQGLATAINGVPRGLAQVAKAVADQKVA